MGDTRFHFKGTFSAYGYDYPWDCSLNWSAPEGQIDERITEFFLHAYNDALRKSEAKDQKEQERRAARELEETERRELQRLQQKYPTP